VHGGGGVQRAHGVVPRCRVAFLLLSDRDQGLVNILELFNEGLLDVDREHDALQVELEFDVHIERSGSLDGHLRDLVGGIVVALDGTLRRYRRVAVYMDQGQVGEAVLILLAFDEKEDLLAILVKQVIVRIDLVVIRRIDDDADIADAK
jgi:hypothetical protein